MKEGDPSRGGVREVTARRWLGGAGGAMTTLSLTVDTEAACLVDYIGVLHILKKLLLKNQ